MSTIAPVAAAAPAAASFPSRNPAGPRAAAVLSWGAMGGPARIADTLTGYGRKEGYDPLANARRAAYMLTRGDARSAAGIFESGSRYYVRALGEVTRHRGALLALHIEGMGAAMRLLEVTDPRLQMVVDGATKLFASR